MQLSGGHRRREYCNDNCKQTAYRTRQEEKRKAQVRQRWAGYSEKTHNQLEWLMNKYGCDFAKMVAGLIDSERELVLQGLIANEVLQAQVSDLEQQLVRYRQLIDLDADICPWTALTPVQEYLRDHDDETIPFRRQGRTIRIGAIDNHARAVSERHGLIQLNDEEIEQCRIYVLKKLGQPVIVHRVADGEEGQKPLEEAERSELQQAQARVAELEQKLTMYRQVVDLDNRTHLEQQLLDIGEQIGYRQFLPADHLVAVGSGLEYWRSFAAGADDETLAQAVSRARRYAENLVAIDAQMEVNKAQRRIAELERQLAQGSLKAVS